MLEAPEIETFDATAVNSARIRQPLYAARKKIFPKRAEGRFRRFKWIVMLITLGIYYLTPWLRWNRGPYAPDQGVLVDLANRRFYFFPIEIWPQEFYFVAGLLIMMAVKFAVVAGFFMHLRFDNKLLTRLFYAGLFLAVVVYVIVLTTFRIWTGG